MNLEDEIYLKLIEKLQEQLDILLQQHKETAIELNVLRTLVRALLITHPNKLLIKDLLAIHQHKIDELIPFPEPELKEYLAKTFAQLAQEQQLLDKDLATFLTDNLVYQAKPKKH